MYHRRIPAGWEGESKRNDRNASRRQLITFGDSKLEGDNKLSDFGVEHGSTVLMITSSNTQEKCIVS